MAKDLVLVKPNLPIQDDPELRKTTKRIHPLQGDMEFEQTRDNINKLARRVTWSNTLYSVGFFVALIMVAASFVTFSGLASIGVFFGAASVFLALYSEVLQRRILLAAPLTKDDPFWKSMPAVSTVHGKEITIALSKKRVKKHIAKKGLSTRRISPVSDFKAGEGESVVWQAQSIEQKGFYLVWLQPWQWNKKACSWEPHPEQFGLQKIDAEDLVAVASCVEEFKQTANGLNQKLLQQTQSHNQNLALNKSLAKEQEQETILQQKQQKRNNQLVEDILKKD